MARKARVRADNGVYHVLLKSKERMIFIADDDGKLFLDVLKTEKERDFLEIYAFCCFNDCIHLVLKEGISGISENIMRIKSAYSRLHNSKHALKGSLFSGRFSSMPLASVLLIADATRFVHRLPLSFGLTLAYEWSSYCKYFKQSTFVSWEEIIILLDSAIDYRIYLESPHENEFLDSKKFKNVEEAEKLEELEDLEQLEELENLKEHANILSKNELVEKIRELFDGVTAEQIEKLNEKEHKILIKRIKEIDGASGEDIADILRLDIGYVKDC